MEEPKRLFKSNSNRVLCGVCGGIGEYFSIDPTIIRLIWVLLGCTGTGIVAYIIAAIIMPEQY
jgi:phage shock protein C